MSPFSLRRTKFDPRGHQVEEAYFGVDGNPLPNKDGVGRLSWAFDENGKQAAETRYAAQGRIMPKQ